MGTYRILVADDEEDIRFMLELHLQRAGYHVTTVADGDAAVKMVAADRFDFVLCDLVMPKLDGMSVIKAIGAMEHQPPVVLMSAHADADTAMKAVNAGAFDYIAKPFRADEVLFRLRRAIEQHALAQRVEALEDVLTEQVNFAGIVARSGAMRRIFDTIDKVAHFKTTVLITGESGTGKELVARALHDRSGRSKHPFIAVNCGAIPEALLESELFGHAKGAFTDANRLRKGLFEEANGGTIFLDEIGELPIQLQVKLLRVLQENEVRRVGDSQPVSIDVRVVAATVRDLPKEVSNKTFREDLYYRLNVLPIHLPPLRDRKSDVPVLINYFIQTLGPQLNPELTGVSHDALNVLKNYEWPGNVRELENTVERALVLADGPEIVPGDLPAKMKVTVDPTHSLIDPNELSIKKATRIIEEDFIRRALKKTGGNRTRAAELLEVSHRTLLYKIKEFGLGHRYDPKD